jgi:hypothetical protein
MSSLDNDYLLRIGKTSVDYYNQIDFKPTKQDFKDWVVSLKEPMKSHFKDMAVSDCIGVLNFKRFFLESRDYGMDEFMKLHLSDEDYKEWNKNN